MIRDIDQWFLQFPDPTKSCLLTLRAIILQSDENITEAWKYRMPFFCYNGKMCCYLWFDKKVEKPYIGIVEGKKMKSADLIQGDRARMKIMLFDPRKDIPIRKLNSVLKEMNALYSKRAR